MQLYHKVAFNYLNAINALVQKLTDNEIAIHKKFAADMADSTSSFRQCLKKANAYYIKNMLNYNKPFEQAYDDVIRNPDCILSFYFDRWRIDKVSALITKRISY